MVSAGLAAVWLRTAETISSLGTYAFLYRRGNTCSHCSPSIMGVMPFSDGERFSYVDRRTIAEFMLNVSSSASAAYGSGCLRPSQ
jgi:hypothetical protein